MLLLLRDRLALVIEDTPVATNNDSDESDSDDDDSSNSDEDRPTPAVIRIASQASVLLINKYLDLMWDCDIYIIAIGELQISLSKFWTLRCNIIAFCPDRKLAWFKNKLKYNDANVKKIKAIITRTWKRYAPEKPEKAPAGQKKNKTREAALVSGISHYHL